MVVEVAAHAGFCMGVSRAMEAAERAAEDGIPSCTLGALIHNPALILADEPTNDLDEHWSEEIIDILKEQTRQGTAVVMVTHNSRWAQHATRRCRLEDGILVDISE